MSQNDFNIANQGFPSFRSDLNSALQALASLSSGDTAPTTTYANQLWYETDTNTLYIRDEANSAWLDLMVIDQATGSPSFTAGNVGIGTDAPSYDLDISKSDTTEVAVRIKNTNTGGADPDAMLYLDSGNVDGEAAVEFMKGGTSYGRLSALDSDMRLVSDTGDIEFTTGGSVSAIITSSGSVGINTTAPEAPLHVVGGDFIIDEANSGASLGPNLKLRRTSTSPADDDYLGAITFQGVNSALAEETYARILAQATDVTDATEDGALTFWTIGAGSFAERARIDNNGGFLVACTSLSTTSSTDTGFSVGSSGTGTFARSGNYAIVAMRQTNDGTIISLRQAGVEEGTISVSGTTVSYNGGHLSRWAQFPDNSRPELLKGTIMSNLDQMANWDQEDNEQLNCVEVSAVEGDANVAGVFVAWDSTDDGYNDILLAMTGDMVIRIAGGTTVQRGDLLMSAGDGTAKPQGDDIVRAKTIAKVTSTHVSHTYADGSYAVPCVLMAC